MSKLNPQKASAYVGPGVLRKGGKITPVPNGPLIKKKGPFKGSSLKSGGKINNLNSNIMATMKKAQTGDKVKQNLKDATQNKNMRNTAPSSGTRKTTMGSKGVIAKSGKTMSKAQSGTVKGNPKGYETASSPMKTTPYEKKLDTVGSGSVKSVRMLSGKGDVLGQERLGSSGADKLASKFKRDKNYTTERRNTNKEFLESRTATGKAASKAKSGASFPDLNKDGKITKADVLKGRGVIAKGGKSMKKCKGGC